MLMTLRKSTYVSGRLCISSVLLHLWNRIISQFTVKVKTRWGSADGEVLEAEASKGQCQLPFLTLIKRKGLPPNQPHHWLQSRGHI